MRRILYHENISRCRRRGVVESPLSDLDRPAPDGTDPDLRLTLDQALSTLTRKQRTVLVLRFYEDLTEVETARQLGIKAGTVKSTTRQAPTRLRANAPHLAELVGSLP